MVALVDNIDSAIKKKSKLAGFDSLIETPLTSSKVE